MTAPWPEDAEFLTPREVRIAFRVDARTVRDWGKRGRLASIRTPGGHRRYHRTEVEALLNGRQAARGAR